MSDQRSELERAASILGAAREIGHGAGVLGAILDGSVGWLQDEMGERRPPTTADLLELVHQIQAQTLVIHEALTGSLGQIDWNTMVRQEQAEVRRLRAIRSAAIVAIQEIRQFSCDLPDLQDVLVILEAEE